MQLYSEVFIFVVWYHCKSFVFRSQIQPIFHKLYDANNGLLKLLCRTVKMWPYRCSMWSMWSWREPNWEPKQICVNICHSTHSRGRLFQSLYLICINHLRAVYTKKHLSLSTFGCMFSTLSFRPCRNAYFWYWEVLPCTLAKCVQAKTKVQALE